jgi:hypothetical protein
MNSGPRRNTLRTAGALALPLSLTSLVFCIWNGLLHGHWHLPLLTISVFWVVWMFHVMRRELRKPMDAHTRGEIGPVLPWKSGGLKRTPRRMLKGDFGNLEIPIMHGTVLLVSKEPHLLKMREELLRRAGCKTFLTDCLEQAEQIIDSEKPDMIILCQSFGVVVQRRFTEELQRQGIRIHVLCL